MKTQNKTKEEQNKKSKIVLPKINVKELATLNEGREWPKKSK